MKTRIFLIHGWGGSPRNDWLPWAIHALEGRGYEVIAPDMPDTDHPKIKPWVDTLSQLVVTPRPTDIFIGHSIGTQTILRYLQTVDASVDKVILVAPWFTLTNLEGPESWSIADPWFKTSMDFARIKPKAREFITIFSDNDPWVPYKESKQLFVERLNPRMITLHSFGHITADEGVTELPTLLDLLK